MSSLGGFFLGLMCSSNRTEETTKVVYERPRQLTPSEIKELEERELNYQRYKAPKVRSAVVSGYSDLNEFLASAPLRTPKNQIIYETLLQESSRQI